MNFSFLVSFLAGISTVLGSFFIFLKNINKDKLIGRSLAFSSGVMTSVSLIDLIPTSISNLNNKFYFILSIMLSFAFIVIGILLSSFINRILPNYENDINGKLYKMGIFAIIAIILHNIPEGIATFLTVSNNRKLGISLAIAIALHNIPEGISISVPIYFSTGNKTKAVLYTFISGISEFIGALVAALFLLDVDIYLFLNLLYSVIAGIMLSLSFDELLPNSFEYWHKRGVIVNYIMGFLFMGILHFFM